MTERDQPPPSKKYKADENTGMGSQTKAGGQSSGQTSDMGSNKGVGKKQAADVALSAPPKLGSKGTNGGGVALQKPVEGEDSGGKVNIPETFEESESDSDLTDRIRRIDGFGDIGQGCSGQKNGEDSQQFWYMEANTTNACMDHLIGGTEKSRKSGTGYMNSEKQLYDTNTTEEGNTQTEVDVTEEAIVYTQESVGTEEEKNGQEGQPEIQEAPLCAEATKTNIQQNQRIRKSDRLKKDIAISTKEKNEMMARKRNLEGNTYTSTMFSDLPIEIIKSLSCNMGVDVHKISFGTFDMLKDLEVARKKLHFLSKAR